MKEGKDQGRGGEGSEGWERDIEMREVLTISLAVHQPDVSCRRSQVLLYFLLIQKIRGRIRGRHMQFDL